ncbi:universal stress protein [Dongia deserti]|uniref:universal stress protein n=1 Tax=Dongia deserti TaxID=2268030 RepID=UPI000E649BB7|nr:universal stress protein [Dongia deserti]
MSTDPGPDPQVQPASAPPAAQERVFLVVVDETPELKVALRYACRRAFRSNGRVAMVHVMEPTGFGDWIGVNELMKDEARQQAEATMQKMATEVNKLSGKMPMLYFREGDRREELLKLIEEEPGISILVLAASTSPKGPGPLVSALTGKYVSKMRVPVTIVPGNLTPEDIEHVA